MNIADILKPIKLLKGSHEDTWKTGSGCLMNVVSYLNGDREITDAPACACPVVMPIAIWLNDYMSDNERQQLLPYVERISGSRTDDINVMVARAWAAVRLSKYAAESAAKYAAEYAAEYVEYAKYAAKYAAKSAKSAKYAESAEYAEYAKSAAKYAAKSAKYAEYAKYAAEYAEYSAEYAALRMELISAALKCLDEMLPVQSRPDDAVIERAHKLVEIANGPI